MHAILGISEKYKIEPFLGITGALAVRSAEKMTFNNQTIYDESQWMWDKKGKSIWNKKLWKYRSLIDFTIPIGVDLNINRKYMIGYEYNFGLNNIWKLDQMVESKYISHIISTGYLF